MSTTNLVLIYLLCCCRWAQFRLGFSEIDSQVKLALKDVTDGVQPVNYRQHIGGGCYVSVTKGFKCVDFRKFYIPYGQTEIRATRKGIALRLAEWDQMKKMMELVDGAYPTLANALPCYLAYDHQNQLAALDCRECHPFTIE